MIFLRQALKLQGPTQKITKLGEGIWHPMDSLQRLRAASSSEHGAGSTERKRWTDGRFWLRAREEKLGAGI